MENPQPSALPSLANALYPLATFIATVASGLIGLFFGRRQRTAETQKTSAETAKTEAETRQIDSSIVLKAFERLDQFENITREQRLRITELEQREMTLEFQLEGEISKSKRIEAEIRLLNAQVARARAAGFLAEDHVPGTPNPAA